ncbi:putative MFS multidrug transporter [Karstenula rhodostoma CBS 690.94]|uniref:MFS multidrug transporter n=1 Tax=Karstenula rhodostoma CBS 690.94 TaxID=1392251 RepID=A0A9P4UD08_9PLEO|nr:putative MFS multidrug transporter [Karstenula rhodostoma CBS 690.94]
MEAPLQVGYLQRPHGWREYVFILVLCSTQLFCQGALGYVIVPLSLIGKTFHQDGYEQAAEMSWHIAAYSLTIGSFILIAGRLGDNYGAKNVLVFGWVWFAVWSIIAGCSAFTHSAIFFDVSRAFQGIGPSLLLPNALSIAGRTYAPGRRKSVVFSFIAMCSPLGAFVGGLVGAAFAQYVWWPWITWISGIGCSVVAATAYLVVSQDRNKTSPRNITFDWIGSFFGVGGLILLNVSWNQAPIDGWSTPYVYVLLVLGFFFLGIFALQERRSKHPIMDISVFNGRVASILLITGLGWASFGIWFYYMFQFLQHIRGLSSLISITQFTPGAIRGMIAPLFVAWSVGKVPTPWLSVISSSAFCLGTLLLATAPVEQTYWFNVFWSFTIMAFGMDISFPASTIFLSDSVSIENQGISASLVNTVINYSIAIGLGIAGTVESQVVKGTSMEARLQGYRSAEWTSVGLAGLGICVALLMVGLKRKKKPEKSEEIARDSEGSY